MLYFNKSNGCMDFYSDRTRKTDVCDAFEIKRIIRSLESRGKNDQLLISVNDHNIESYSFKIPLTVVSATEKLTEEFANNGLIIPAYYEHSAACYLINQYMECKKNRLFNYTHSRLGWYNYNGKKIFLHKENMLNGNISISNHENFAFQMGDSKAYRDFLENRIYTNPTLALGMSLGYSAVVLSYLKDIYDFGETTIINLCGASSTGKTTISQLLVSPFGSPVISNYNTLVRTFHSTNNAIYAALEGIHGIPMVLDDITTNPNINTANLVYTLASGEEKGRCNSEGMVKNTGNGWSGLIVISSETPIEDSSSENQGLKVRVIQTAGITWTPDAKTAEEIKNFVKKNYGHTGVEFAEYVASLPLHDLMDKFDNAKSIVHSMMTERDNLSERLETKYAAIALTIELMNSCFELSLDMPSLMKILLTPEQNTVSQRDISKKALEYIKNFIVEKKTHFHCKDARNGRSILSRFAAGDNYGSIVLNKEFTDVYIPTAKVEEILIKNRINEISTVKSRWKENGITKCDTDRTDCKHLKRRCIHFIFSGNDVLKDFEDERNTAAEEAPVSAMTFDDDKAVAEIFGGIG